MRHVTFVTALEQTRAARQDQAGDAQPATQRHMQCDVTAEGIAS